MIEDMVLRDFSPRTRDAYVFAVADLARFYDRSPDLLEEQEVRRYFLELVEVRELSPSSVRQRVSGIRFFYTTTVPRNWDIFEVITPRRGRKLPVVLSRDEVRRVIEAIRKPVCRMAALCAYVCGLRISELLALHLHQVDFERMQVCVVDGKGRKDRNVPLPERLAELLREYCVARKITDFLFPSGAHWCNGSPIAAATLQRAVRLAAKEAQIGKRTSPHTFRHCYATHLLECGVRLPVIQRLLGHRRAETTTIYTHLTDPMLDRLARALDEITEGF
jgi:site-specific recombinase XerD